MSEEKLTVAELLARRQKEGAPSEPPRRRRRRSLEEGGVSVQELTGSIPRVKADEPRRGAHALSNADDDQTTASDLLADEAAANAAEEAQATEPETEAPEQPETAAGSEVVVEEPDSSEPEVQAEAEAEAAVQEEDEPEVAEADGEVAEDEAEAPAAPAAPQQEQAAQSAPTAQPTAPAVPLAIPMEPRPVMVNSERSEITYTFTELRDMADDSRKIGEPGPVARAVLTGSNAYDDRPTASIPVVQDNLGEAPESSEVPEASVESDDTDTDTDTAAASETAVAAAVAPEVAQAEGAPSDAEQAEDVPSETTPAEATPTEAAADEKKPQSRDVVKREESKSKDAAREDYAEDNSLSVPLLLIQVFVGLIVGALVFLGFTMAWSSLPKIVVVIMALVVTGGFAGIANYVRREKDKLTPVLAGLVGLALTFGPWIIFQL
ncbi:flagellar biosynthetic protein FliQ [Corynebacterium vitaeruminis]|uniref:flagellar biosynthetic protein FliQ n=1 Tax=Corynebacterium vitaeruminis TaxID=38305 RepID=UPI00065FD0AC|nr:flagellar biosynthetic protein FliQ [Corynebacterium vitaeruminis]